LRGMAKLLDARAAKAKLAANIVQGLADGKLPTAEQLAACGALPSGVALASQSNALGH
jgi:hypothetical protein